MSNRIITALAATVLAIPAVAAPAGYFQIPGTETTMKIYGKAETWGYLNMDQAGFGDVTQDQSWNKKGTTDSITYGRFGFTTTTPSSYGDVNVKVEYEGRTVGGGTNSYGAPFRLRHAYGEFGGLLIGQTNSLWVAWQYCPAYNDTWNSDFSGATYRTRQIRYTFNPAPAFAVAFSAEQDLSGGVTSNTPLYSKLTKPGTSLFGSVKFEGDWGGVVGTVGYMKHEEWSGQPANTTQSGTGVSFNVGGNFNITANDNIGLRIINGGGHTGTGAGDGFYQKTGDTSFSFYKSTSIDLGYSHTWNDQFTTNLGIAQILFKKDVDAGVPSKVTVNEFFVNTNWAITKNATFGVEYFDSSLKVNEGNPVQKSDLSFTNKTHNNGMNLMFSYQFF
jgi:hypothetical protein